jgi:hypothetical protein
MFVKPSVVFALAYLEVECFCENNLINEQGRLYECRSGQTEVQRTNLENLLDVDGMRRRTENLPEIAISMRREKMNVKMNVPMVRALL